MPENTHIIIFIFPRVKFFNVNTADKYLQFGHDKCKAMLVGKQTSTFHLPHLQVDTWKRKYEEDGTFIEEFDGKKKTENTKELTYLGVQLSDNGSNLNTIIKKRNKQKGTNKRILNLIKFLEKYTF